MIIVDTNVQSEPLKPKPDPSVVAWLNLQIPTDLFVTAVTQAEMEYGPWALPKGKRRAQLHQAASELLEVEFSGRVQPFDPGAALMFGANIAPARQKRCKDAVSDADGMIAAVAISHDRCAVATRYGRPFAFMRLEVIDPWAM